MADGQGVVGRVRRAKRVFDTGAAPLLQFENVTKRFGAFTAVDDLTLDIYDDEFFALLGPSGCGKTTLLRMIAGFEVPDAGRVLLAGEDIVPVPPYRRPVNMMFQSYALFPHLTVAGNIAFGLKQDRLPRHEIAARVEEMLTLVQLQGLASRKPDQLSGGQRQRVALARALAKRPKVLLLDEPLAALDRKLREETRFELSALQTRLKLTFLIVTHDRDEAMTLADRIAVMERGSIAQVAAPMEIYEQPRSRFVADFIGDVNLIEGRLVANEYGAAVDTAAGRLSVATAGDARPGDTVWLAVRPEKMRIGGEAAPGANQVSGQVIETGYLGDVSVYKLRLDRGVTAKVTVPNASRMAAADIAPDDRVSVSWMPDAGIVLTR